MFSKNFALVILVVIPEIVAAQNASGPPAGQPPKEETCVVSGMVVRRTDTAPLKGALVQLFNPDGGEHNIATRTGADGRFELKNVPAGKYRLMVSRNGYFRVEYGQKKPSDPGATFSLRPGQHMSDLLFKLGLAGVITGKILDENGEPMAYVAVTALRTGYVGGRRQLITVDEKHSNDLGEFRLFGLTPGKYFVSAEPSRWERAVGDRQYSGEEKGSGEKGYTKVFFPSATDPAKASTLIVKEGEEIPSIDFLMKEIMVYRIRGRVAGPVSKQGPQQIRVEVFRRSERMGWGSFTGSPDSIKADGSFEVPQIPPGEYTVRATASEEGQRYSAAQDVDVVAADVEGLSLVLAPGVTIPGRILWDGQPSLGREELSVFLESDETRYGINGGRVDKNNQFTLEAVPEGSFKVDLFGLGKDGYIKEVKFGEAVLADTELRVVRGGGATLEITASSRGARMQGTVLDEEALPVAGVWVVAVPEEAKRKYLRLYKSALTDQYGHFEIRAITPGTYKIFSWEGIESEAWEDEDFLKEFEEKGTLTEVHGGEAKVVELKVIPVKQGTGNPD